MEMTVARESPVEAMSSVPVTTPAPRMALSIAPALTLRTSCVDGAVPISIPALPLFQPPTGVIERYL